MFELLLQPINEQPGKEKDIEGRTKKRVSIDVLGNVYGYVSSERSQVS